MRTRTLLTSAFLLIVAPSCEPKGEADSGSETEGESETDGERTLDEWITLCESQTNAANCEAVPPQTHEGETLHCADLIIVKTSEPDCFSVANDSRCFAVSDKSPAEPGYILAEPGAPDIWLIEAPPSTTVYGSALTSCTLADDGVTWTPDAMCGCAGKVSDSEGR